MAYEMHRIEYIDTTFQSSSHLPCCDTESLIAQIWNIKNACKFIRSIPVSFHYERVHFFAYILWSNKIESTLSVLEVHCHFKFYFGRLCRCLHDPSISWITSSVIVTLYWQEVYVAINRISRDENQKYRQVATKHAYISNEQWKLILLLLEWHLKFKFSLRPLSWCLTRVNSLQHKWNINEIAKINVKITYHYYLPHWHEASELKMKSGPFVKCIHKNAFFM